MYRGIWSFPVGKDDTREDEWTLSSAVPGD